VNDSDKGKQAKNNLSDMQKNKAKGKVATVANNNSLDDLLSFDARVLAAGSATGIDINEINELPEKSVNQQLELSIEEYEAKGELTKDVEQASDELIDTVPESEAPDVEQQESDSGSADISDQDKRISQLEDELSKLKKMSVLGLILAVLALVISVWFGVFSSDTQLKPIEQPKLVKSVNSSVVAPEIEVNTQEIDHSIIKTKASDAETNDLEKTPVVPESDIPEIKTLDAVAEQPVFEVEEKGWSVNLNSYPNRVETDKKMQELKKQGIPAEVVVVTVNEVQWYRIRVTGFETKVEADAYADKVIKILGRSRAWVSKI